MAMYGIKVKGSQSIVSINLDKFNKLLLEKCEEQNKLAVRVWLRTILDHIPTYTGTARGTFKPLGRVVNYTVPLVGKAGRPGKTAKNPHKKHISYGGSTFAMGFSAGGQHAEYKLDVKVSNLEIKCSFIFTNNLPYVAYNDVNSAPSGFVLPSNPPWHSHERGVEAWKRYILTEVPKKLLVPKEFIRIVKMKVR